MFLSTAPEKVANRAFIIVFHGLYQRYNCVEFSQNVKQRSSYSNKASKNQITKYFI